MSTFGVVLVTASSREEALRLADHLVNESLAACVSFFPMHSVYSWQGTIHHDDEWQMVIKTNLDYFNLLAARVKELHSYEVPEVIALPISQGSKPYLDWLAEQTTFK
ncbi:MAG: divalent-cation tolerance protein CutA [Cyanobacteria bacterium Co-bin8]|nr:divalent-cation tolerance protein CutA [Cyanobacteria bacterium Co-bin8]